ncbi:MAG: class I SAM-dependent methyltransferase [Alphaproteobacteria bacterium]|nr:class I SAM-dependent methyltransferase [Alphaproteobacteria bacterium]
MLTMNYDRWTTSRYRNMRRLNEYYLDKAGIDRFRAEMERRGSGMTLTLDSEFFQTMSPLFDPARALNWAACRYRPAFEYLDANPVESVLEIGCAHGLATWLAADGAKHIVGVDPLASRIEVGRKLFPEIELHRIGYREFLAANSNRKFDLIFEAGGPIGMSEEGVRDILNHCRVFISMRVSTWHWKMPCRRLSFEATAFGEVEPGIAPGFFRHYATHHFYATAITHLRGEHHFFDSRIPY